MSSPLTKIQRVQQGINDVKGIMQGKVAQHAAQLEKQEGLEEKVDEAAKAAAVFQKRDTAKASSLGARAWKCFSDGMASFGRMLLSIFTCCCPKSNRK